MKILVVYGSVEGQTRKIAKTVADSFSKLGHEASVLDASARLQKDFSIDNYDAFVIGASIHQAAHQEAAVEFIRAQIQALQSKPSALISVSLAAALDPSLQEARGYVDKLESTTGWTPDATLLAAGALRYDEYDFFKQQLVKFIVAEKGAGTEANQNHEYTDWEAVDAFVTDFAAKAAAAAAA